MKTNMQLGPCHTQLNRTPPAAIPRSCTITHTGAPAMAELTGEGSCLAAPLLCIAAAACSPALLLAPVLLTGVPLLAPVMRAASSLLASVMSASTSLLAPVMHATAREHAGRGRCCVRLCCAPPPLLAPMPPSLPGGCSHSVRRLLHCRHASRRRQRAAMPEGGGNDRSVW